MSDLVRLISQASTALAKLDVDTLEELTLQAQTLAETDLATLSVRNAGVLALLTRQIRSFSTILSATGENLSALKRVSGAPASKNGGNAAGYEGPPRGLLESFALYEDQTLEQSIWPGMRAMEAYVRGRQ